MEIQRVDIINFRRNKRLTVIFDPITTIRGASAWGKSSLMGALRWVVFNEPKGKRFISWGESYAAVRLVLCNGTQIIRKRSSKENYYKLVQQKHTRKFEALGTGVPPAIQAALQIDPINFRRQHEGFFWLSLSPAEVSRRLNKIVNLEEIDKANRKAAEMLSRVRADIRNAQERMEEAEGKAKGLAYILLASQELAIIEGYEEKAGKIAQEAVRASKAVEEAQRRRQEADRANERVLDAFKAHTDVQDYTQKAAQRQKASQLLELALVQQRRAHREPLQASTALKAAETWKRTHTTLQRLLRAVEAAERESRTIQALTRRIDKAENSIQQGMGAQCPLCNSVLEQKQ